MPELKLTADAPRFAVNEEGMFVRVYTLTGLAPLWHAGWLTDLYPYLHEARISLRPLEDGRGEAVRHYRSLAAAVELRMREGRHVDPERAMELEAARAVASGISLSPSGSATGQPGRRRAPGRARPFPSSPSGPRGSRAGRPSPRPRRRHPRASRVYFHCYFRKYACACYRLPRVIGNMDRVYGFSRVDGGPAGIRTRGFRLRRPA
ncbi:MAG: hypothetical protein ACP5UK_07145, partial [Conexivisphaera sp.]